MTQPAFSTAVAHPFHFLRHGETTWNASKRTQGQLDTPLNETGHAQAQRAAETIAPLPISRIVASPLSRVADTARPVAEAL
ncbi:MAG: histidine phosphatase family protein, partial [Pseudomonadota bacterium]